MDRFSEMAATWDEAPGHVERARTVADAVAAAVPLRDDVRMLEIGAGTGLLSRAMADRVGTAVVTDVAPGMVEVAAQRLEESGLAGWSARVFDIEHDDLPAERFGLVVGLLTLHHMGDIPAVLARCAELLEPGGWVAMVDLDHDHEGAFHSHLHDFDGHHGFTRASVSTWLEDAGFVDVAVSDAGSVVKGEPGHEQEFDMFLAVGRRP